MADSASTTSSSAPSAPASAPETSAAQPAENNQAAATPATPKYRERLGKRYPDAKPQTDQEWDDLAERAYGEDEAELNRYKDNNKVIEDVLDSDKDARAVISEMLMNGTPFRAAVAKFFDADSLTPKEGDDDYGYYQKTAEERRQMSKQFKERGAQKRANEKEAYDNIDKFAEKQGMDQAAKDAFISFVNELYNDLSVLKLTPKTLEKLHKAMNYDADVAAAAEDAEINAKNAAIEASRVKKGAETAGDGVPTPQGGSAPAKEAPKRKPSIFDGIGERKFQ